MQTRQSDLALIMILSCANPTAKCYSLPVCRYCIRECVDEQGNHFCGSCTWPGCLGSSGSMTCSGIVTPFAKDLLPMLTYHTCASIQVDSELSSFCMYRCLMVTWHTCIKLVSLPRIRMRLWTAGHVTTFWLLKLTGTLFSLYDTNVGVGISCVCDCKKNTSVTAQMLWHRS